jgi:hypothetical protein
MDVRYKFEKESDDQEEMKETTRAEMGNHLLSGA